MRTKNDIPFVGNVSSKLKGLEGVLPNVVLRALCDGNLFSNDDVVIFDNCTFADKVYTQNVADEADVINWKIQTYQDNNFVEQLLVFRDDTKGVKSVELAYPAIAFNRMRLAINGISIDTGIRFTDNTGLQVGDVFRLQWNVLNTTQGQISWSGICIKKV